MLLPFASKPGGSVAATPALGFYPFVDRTGNIGFSGDRMRAAGFILPYSVTFSKILIYVNTADAGHNYSFGIYNSSGTLKAHTTAASLTSTGSIELSTIEGSQTLSPGKYYFGQTGASGATAAIAMCSTAFLTFFSEGILTETTSGGAVAASISPPADSWTLGGQEYSFGLR